MLVLIVALSKCGARLLVSESRVEVLVRPVYQDDGHGSTLDGGRVQASPAGGLLPI
jgi:hypothetical protein